MRNKAASSNIGIDIECTTCNSGANAVSITRLPEPDRHRAACSDCHGVQQSERQAVNSDGKIEVDVAWLHRIWREIDGKIDTYAGRVREGVEVLPASDFARWVRFSGLLELLEANSMDVPWAVDGPRLREKVRELIYDCGEWFRLHERSSAVFNPMVPRCELERITEQLTILAGQVAKLSPPSTETAAPARPGLRVIQGGANC